MLDLPSLGRAERFEECIDIPLRRLLGKPLDLVDMARTELRLSASTEKANVLTR